MSNDGAHATHKTAAPMRNNDIKQKKLYRIDLKKKKTRASRANYRNWFAWKKMQEQSYDFTKKKFPTIFPI
jgi:hypothetical protein